MGGNTPTDIANQALDAIGRPFDSLGDIEDGSTQAQVLLRAYGQCLRQLLRAAHWNWARKQGPMLLLADATGNTENVGTVVPQGWLYEYALPTDSMKPRFVPINLDNPANLSPSNNIQIPSTPLVTGIGDLPVPFRPQPAKFLEATDFNYPGNAGDFETPGVSPIGRTVILTNVRNATLVYTAYMPYPSVWDSLFRSAMVAYLASEVALPLWVKEDKAFGLRVRGEQENIVRSKVIQARLTDGNVGGPMTSDLRVDWMDTRRGGGPNSFYGAGPWGGGAFGAGLGDGIFWNGYDQLALASGAVF